MLGCIGLDDGLIVEIDERRQRVYSYIKHGRVVDEKIISGTRNLMRVATKNIADGVPRVSGGYRNPVAGSRRGQAQRSMRRGLHRGGKDG